LLDRERVIVVGDSLWDVQAAQAGGTGSRLGSIGVETGGFSRDELSEAGAIAVSRDVKEWLDQLLTRPTGRFVP
jgi:phosphoglycolate phosphatase-like HAD superfamily hydrolase